MRDIRMSMHLHVSFATVLFTIAALGAPARADDAALAAQLRSLDDREQIRALITAYGRTLDTRDFAAFAALFAESGGEWVGGFGTATGRDAIRKMMEERIGITPPRTPSFHIFTNETITLDGDRAMALTKWIFVIQGESARPELMYLGHYDDRLVRERGAWRFQRRVVHGDIPANDPLQSPPATPAP